MSRTASSPHWNPSSLCRWDTTCYSPTNYQYTHDGSDDCRESSWSPPLPQTTTDRWSTPPHLNDSHQLPFNDSHQSPFNDSHQLPFRRSCSVWTAKLAWRAVNYWELSYSWFSRDFSFGRAVQSWQDNAGLIGWGSRHRRQFPILRTLSWRRWWDWWGGRVVLRQWIDPWTCRSMNCASTARISSWLSPTGSADRHPLPPHPLTLFHCSARDWNMCWDIYRFPYPAWSWVPPLSCEKSDPLSSWCWYSVLKNQRNRSPTALSWQSRTERAPLWVTHHSFRSQYKRACVFARGFCACR